MSEQLAQKLYEVIMKLLKKNLSRDYHSPTVLPNHFYLLKNEVHFALPAYPNLCQQQL